MKGKSPHRPEAKPAAGILRSAQKSPTLKKPSFEETKSSAEKSGQGKKKRPSASDYF